MNSMLAVLYLGADKAGTQQRTRSRRGRAARAANGADPALVLARLLAGVVALPDISFDLG